MASASSVPGTNVPPISFPGIVSGVDYNSIIKQLTSLSLAPTVGLNAAVTTLNNANAELIKINNLLACVQNSLQNLSNPDIYNAYTATSSSTALAASGIAGTAAVPGTYTVEKVVTATSSSVTSNANAGHSITDLITSGVYAGQASNTVPLANSYAQVTPTNGGGSLGQVTVDGVSISYNVNTQSLNQILGAIQAGVRASADANFTAQLVGGTVQFSSTDAPISLGSSSDKGNLLDVLKLSNAQLNNGPGSGSVTGTSDVGGINLTASFNTANGANYKTAVTAGYFTLNGTKISVDTGQNTADIIKEINNAGAGVVASFDSTTGLVSLTATNSGPVGIVLGAAGDTSNFLTAAGLTAASGATSQIGSQSEVDLLTTNGGTQKYFNNSNTVTNVIPGISLSLQNSTNTPFVVTVGADTSQLTSTVQGFITSYNAAVTEINNATAPPIVTPAAPGSGGQAASIGGGVLFGNTNAQQIVQQLTQIVSGFLGSNSHYNSLSQIGISVSDSFSTYTTANNANSQGVSGGNVASGTSANASVKQTTFLGTDGTLQALDFKKFSAALAANPSAVQSLLSSASGLTTQLGTYLTTVTGAPTILDSGPVGTLPNVSILQNFENANTDSISAYQKQIQQLTDTANQQANNLRQQFVASETLVAQLQSEQQQLAAALGFTVSSSSSSGG